MSFYEEEKSKGNTLKAPQKLHDAIDNLASWSEGWNSYDALPIAPEAIAHAHHWVEHSLPCGLKRDMPHRPPFTEWVPPHVTGDACDRGVVLWWIHSRSDRPGVDRRLTIYIDPDGTVSYVRCDGENITDDEGPIGYDTWILLWYWLFS